MRPAIFPDDQQVAMSYFLRPAWPAAIADHLSLVVVFLAKPESRSLPV